VLTDIGHRPDSADGANTSGTGGAQATLALVPVADPTAYGAGPPARGSLPCGDFLEKPSPRRESTRNLISAGAYVLEREDPRARASGSQRLDRARGVAAVDRAKGLYGFPSESYWLDIGLSPSATCRATFDIIEGKREDGRRRASRRRPGWRSTQAAEVHGRVIPARRFSSAACRIAAGCARRQSGRARRRRLDRRRHDRRALGDPQRCRDRRGLHAARLHPSRRGARVGARTANQWAAPVAR